MKLIDRFKAKRRPRTKADFDWISQGAAEDELAQAFNLPSEVISMLLHGLVATGTVHALDRDNGELIDIDECKIWELEGNIKSVSADELRFWLSRLSTVPQGPQGRDRLIARKLGEGINPPRNIRWKEFYVFSFATSVVAGLATALNVVLHWVLATSKSNALSKT
jgi:hypothetical protein